MERGETNNKTLREMVEYSKVLIAEQYRVGSETYYAPCLRSFFLSPIMGDEMPLELVVLDLARRM